MPKLPGHVQMEPGCAIRALERLIRPITVAMSLSVAAPLLITYMAALAPHQTLQTSNVNDNVPSLPCAFPSQITSTSITAFGRCKEANSSFGSHSGGFLIIDDAIATGSYRPQSSKQAIVPTPHMRPIFSPKLSPPPSPPSPSSPAPSTSTGGGSWTLGWCGSSARDKSNIHDKYK
ncbi:hypothetical protein SMACR_09116 [Sordaria macrospora]|uniref:Uncharacterized protein n=1 Tax=Sordaria macrospora TaxID=5147 RepID=A0A8S8ZEH2_SORMA|nr:hypothetical protein SMACR_09116 [Sordaria macrospora]WPJ57221.1 hypothetical protein SMAC4_09116 [Sordaria macrospora]